MSETVEGAFRPDRLTDDVEPYEQHAPYEQDSPHELNEHDELNELDELNEHDELNQLDEQLIALVLERSRQARTDQLARRTSGRPMSPLARENAMLRRYAQHLGREGTAIALAVLALSRRR